MVHQKAVAIEADAQPPAAIAIAQVLQGRIPDQPIQQQGLPALTAAGGNRHEPGGIRFGLGARQLLPEVPTPLDGSTRGFDRFTPGVGGPGTEAMAARRQTIQVQLHLAILHLVQADRGAIIHLHGHMGAEPQLEIPADGPVLHGQLQVQPVAVDHAAIGGTQQLELGVVHGQLAPQVLNSPRWCHLLQASGWRPTRQGGIHRGAPAQPSRSSLAGHRCNQQKRAGQQNPQQQRLQAPVWHDTQCNRFILPSAVSTETVFIN